MSINIYKNGALQTVAGSSVMDAQLDANSTNGVQNKVVTAAINMINNNLAELKTHEYTSTEKQVGKIGNDYVYEKTYYNVSEIASGNTVIDSSITPSTIKALVSIEGSVYTPVNGYIESINLIGTAIQIYCDISPNGITLHSNVSVSKIFITYRYIKN